ncbi:MAG: SGNH/GDSL hydrolase family protein [Candidatus Hydrogenedentes bacterium]|nr:SGNH/GDSL hydrolase family protein [Candidatus Hydrogenedentota bacterium]
MKKVQVLKNGVVILAITLVLVAAIEVSLRIIYPEKIERSGRSSESLAFEFDEDFLVRMKPDMAKTFVRTKENGGDTIHWRTNADSFRGAELENDVDRRIIVYGDSNVLARFSNNENTFVTKLGKYLNENGTGDVEVINAGVIGFGPDQSLIRFEKEADLYKPDLVVFHIFADNDFGDLIRNRLFDLDTADELVETRHKKSIDEVLVAKQDQTIIEFLNASLIVRATNKIARSLRGNDDEDIFSLLMRKCEIEFRVYKESRPRSFSHFGDHYDLDMALALGNESTTTKMKLMAAVLKRAKEFARSKGIGFLVLIQPSQIDVTANGVLDSEYLLNRNADYKRSRLTGAVKQICVASDIQYVDLFDVYMRNDPDVLYFGGLNSHWNDAGQDLAAEEMVQYILQNRMLVKPSEPLPQDSV